LRAPKANAAYWSAKIKRNRNRDIRIWRALRLAGWTSLAAWEASPAHRRCWTARPDNGAQWFARLAQEAEGCCSRSLIKISDWISERPPHWRSFFLCRSCCGALVAIGT